MASSVPPGSRARLLHSVEQIDLATAFDAACRQSGLTHDQVARLMDITPDHLYQQLGKQRHLSLLRLLKLRDDEDGRRFLRVYWPLVAEDMGLPEFADGYRVADALHQFINNLQVRMVRCELVAREINDGKKSA